MHVNEDVWWGVLGLLGTHAWWGVLGLLGTHAWWGVLGLLGTPVVPRRLAMLLRLLPVLWPVPPMGPITPRRHGQQPVHAKTSRCPLRLELVAIEEAMTTDVSKRGYQMVLL